MRIIHSIQLESDLARAEELLKLAEFRVDWIKNGPFSWEYRETPDSPWSTSAKDPDFLDRGEYRRKIEPTTSHEQSEVSIAEHNEPIKKRWEEVWHKGTHQLEFKNTKGEWIPSMCCTKGGADWEHLLYRLVELPEESILKEEQPTPLPVLEKMEAPITKSILQQNEPVRKRWAELKKKGTHRLEFADGGRWWESNNPQWGTFIYRISSRMTPTKWVPWSLEKHPRGSVWVKKGKVEYLITSWEENSVTVADTHYSYSELLENFILLDDGYTPCGWKDES